MESSEGRGDVLFHVVVLSLQKEGSGACVCVCTQTAFNNCKFGTQCLISPSQNVLCSFPLGGLCRGLLNLPHCLGLVVAMAQQNILCGGAEVYF